MIDVEPGAPGDKTGQRLRQFDDERLPRRGRQIVAQQERLADRGKMAEPLDDAVDRERRNVGGGILHQHQAGFRRAHFGDRRGDGARQRGAAGDRRLHRGAAGRDRIDQIGVDE